MELPTASLPAFNPPGSSGNSNDPTFTFEVRRQGWIERCRGEGMQESEGGGRAQQLGFFFFSFLFLSLSGHCFSRPRLT